MSLSAGTRLGPYEIVELLGAGGMGEVYRGTDTRLERNVAIKVLSSGITPNEELRRRFEREAKAISALTHPNICTLYDVGQHDGVEYLVMELLEGETLGDRIQRGLIPVDEVVRIGSEIADALERAHRAGVVHRDLKPGNIFLTPHGVKLLDFGLAKYGEPDVLTTSSAGMKTEKRPLTAEGSIVGTFFYMAPEQLEGREVDRRADIFALGVVLYEMATSQRPFDGTSRASVIASVLERQAPHVSERCPTAKVLDEAIDACLRKNPDERIQNAFDVKLALQWALRSRVETVEAPRPKRWALFGTTALALVAAAVAVFFALRPRPAATPQVAIRATLLLPAHQSLGVMASPSISPDGSSIVFRLANEKSALWLRRLSEADAHPISGTDGATLPFWAPDSRSIGFFADGKLKTAGSGGGTPFVVCDAPGGRGGTWNRDGTILFAGGGTPIFRVSSQGGPVTPVSALRTAPRDSSHRFPSFLPDGKHFLFFVISDETATNRSYAVYAGSLGSHEIRLILEVPSRALYSCGHLFYELQGNLVSRPFDPESLELTGEPSVVAEEVQYFRPFAWGDFSVSDDGVLAYVVAMPSRASVIRFDTTGRKLGTIGEPDYQKYSSLSPQGDRLALLRFDPHTQDGDLWIVGTKQNEVFRLTHESGGYMRPIWSPDGQRVLFGTEKHTFQDLFVVSVRGGAPQLFIGGEGYKIPSDWSSTGFVAFTCGGPKTSWDVWIAPAEHPERAFPFIAGTALEVDAHFSPDGRAIAYSSNETGPFEVYVRPFPGVADAIRISTEGGSSPRWSRDGTQLYYLRNGDAEVMRVPVTSTIPLRTGQAQALFPSQIANSAVDSSDYDISPDGSEIILTVSEEPPARQMYVDTVWRTAAAK